MVGRAGNLIKMEDRPGESVNANGPNSETGFKVRFTSTETKIIAAITDMKTH